MSDRVTCIVCRFSHLKTDCVTGAPILECRHRSPALTGWPTVKASDGCGEGERGRGTTGGEQ